MKTFPSKIAKRRGKFWVTRGGRTSWFTAAPDNHVLAFMIIETLASSDEAWDYFPLFAEEVVAKLNPDEWVVTREEVLAWLDSHRDARVGWKAIGS